MGLLKLAFDRQNKTLVSYNGSVTAFPPFYQSNTQQIQITIVDQSAGGPFRAAYTAVDCSDSELRVVIVTAVTGSTDVLLAATYASGWTYDSENKCFTGEINFNTEETAAFIGESAFKAAILEVNLVTDDVSETVFGSKNGATNITINANADDSESEVPSVLTETGGLSRVTLVDGDNVSFADNVVTISSLGLGSAPSYFLIFGVEAPDGYGPITASFVQGSGSSDGFSVVLSAVPEVDTYKLVYLPVA